MKAPKVKQKNSFSQGSRKPPRKERASPWPRQGLLLEGSVAPTVVSFNAAMRACELWQARCALAVFFETQACPFEGS